MIRAVRDAVIAELDDVLPESVFKSYMAAEGPSRYAVVFVARTRKVRPRSTSGQVRDVYTVTVHSVGVDEDSALWVQEHVDAALTDRVLRVPGVKTWAASYVTGRPPSNDDTSDVPMWFTVSQFDIICDPA